MIFKTFFILIIFYLALSQKKFVVLADDLEKFVEAISQLNTTDFEQIVTIGNRCLTKFRVISFIKDFDAKYKIENPNHLFDWMFIRNYTKFSEALKNDFNDTFAFESLTISSYSAEVHNHKYNFLFNHVFQNFNKTEKLNINRYTFEKYYTLIKDKYDYLTRNSQNSFINNQKHTVYIAYFPELTRQSQLEIFDLLKVIKSKRNSNFLVLVLGRINFADNNFEIDKVIEGNLIFHHIEFYNNPLWHSRNSVNQWNQILNSIPFKPKT